MLWFLSQEQPKYILKVRINMKSKIKKLTGTSHQFDIEISKEKVDKAINEVLEEVRMEAVLPGFRKGRAPIDLVRKKHQKEILDEAVGRLIPQAYQHAIDEHGVEPVSYPEVSAVDIAHSGELTFKAKFDVRPEVNLKKYKGLKVKSGKVSITDEEFKEALERIRGIYAEYSATERPLQKGDIAVCDVETFMDSKLVAKKRENMWVEVNKEVSLLGMGEELCGLTKGDKKDIEVMVPENYPDKGYAGKKAFFKVEVKDTKEKKLPELDDELAKKIGKENIDDLRQEIRSQLLERKEANARVLLTNQLLEQLLKSHDFDLPASMVARQLKVLMEKMEAELVQKGVDAAAIETNKKTIEKKLAAEAENKVRLYFILDKIADNEKIQVTEEETANWLKSLADSINKPFEEVKKYYEEHDLLDGLREQLREEKTMDFLLSEAAINEQ